MCATGSNPSSTGDTADTSASTSPFPLNDLILPRSSSTSSLTHALATPVKQTSMSRGRVTGPFDSAASSPEAGPSSSSSSAGKKRCIGMFDVIMYRICTGFLTTI